MPALTHCLESLWAIEPFAAQVWIGASLLCFILVDPERTPRGVGALMAVGLVYFSWVLSADVVRFLKVPASQVLDILRSPSWNQYASCWYRSFVSRAALFAVLGWGLLLILTARLVRNATKLFTPRGHPSI